VSETVVVSPAKVRAAKLLVRLSEEDGTEVDDAVRAIAGATQETVAADPGPAAFTENHAVPTQIRGADGEVFTVKSDGHNGWLVWIADGVAHPSLEDARHALERLADSDAVQIPSRPQAEDREARRTLERQAEAGDAKAMTRLGALLLNLTPPDTKGALHWLRRAVEIDTAGRVQ
jgi:TPR repeat protein